ncbi:hypothetical protein T439DRAFT_322458 [Meredithblackwellia eburnea MCA 4105]
MGPPSHMLRLIGISLILSTLVLLLLQRQASVVETANGLASRWSGRRSQVVFAEDDAAPSSSPSLFQPTMEQCANIEPVQFHPSPAHRTILASYPRSGNSHLRSLVQRSTGYVSGSTYCDAEIAEALIGECNSTDKFFFKSHFPSGQLWSVQLRENPNYWKSFDQVVYLERNPFDSLYSDWHRVRTGGSMTARAELVGLLGDLPEDEALIAGMTRIYNAHHSYWYSVPIPRFVVQYEDMRVPYLLRPLLDHLSSFLLGEDEPVDPLRIACAAQDDPSKEVYKSRKHKTFHSWDQWNPVLREKVLVAMLPTLCRSAYLQKMQHAFPDDPFVQSLQCPTFDSEGISRIIAESARDLGGKAPKILAQPSKTTEGKHDFKLLESYCPSYAVPDSSLAKGQSEWHRAVLNRKACKAENQEIVDRLLESSLLQCFSWCVFDLGPHTGSLESGRGRSRTRLDAGYDDGKRQGWTLKGSCWAPFDASESTCAKEWVWVKGRLGLQ